MGGFPARVLSGWLAESLDAHAHNGSPTYGEPCAGNQSYRLCPVHAGHARSAVGGTLANRSKLFAKVQAIARWWKLVLMGILRFKPDIWIHWIHCDAYLKKTSWCCNCVITKFIWNVLLNVWMCNTWTSASPWGVSVCRWDRLAEHYPSVRSLELQIKSLRSLNVSIGNV